MPIANRSIAMFGLNYLPEPTGIAPYTAGLAAWLTERGAAVSAVTTHPHYPEWTIRPGYGQWRKQEIHNGHSVERLLHYVPEKVTPIKRSLSEITFGLRSSLARWRKPSAMVFVSPALLSSAMGIARASITHPGVPTVLWVQDIYSLGVVQTGAGAGRSAQMITSIEKWALTRVSKVVVIHERFKDYLVREMEIPAEKIEVVRNWTHVADSEILPDPTFRERMGWGSDETIVVHAGAQGAKQDLLNVVEAARLADERELPIRFVLIGDGNQHRALRAAGEGIERLDFVPPLDDTDFAAALTNADVLLVNEKPGMTEMAVPSKLTTYFNAARPVLAATGAQSVTAEEIILSRGGLRVEPGAPEALLLGVLSLRDDPEMAAEMGAAGRRFRVETLSAEASLSRFERILSDLIGTSTSAADAGPVPLVG